MSQNFGKSVEFLFFTLVEPRWSQWSEWSECAPDCTRVKKRYCIVPPGQPNRQCVGKDIQTANCPSEICQALHDPREGMS